MRLVFLADQIPESLQAIVEFLNERMTPTTVLAVEVKQYRTEQGQQLLSASVLGQTEQARVVKGKASLRPAVIPVLHRAGQLREGQTLWLLPQVLPPDYRPTEVDDNRLTFTLASVSGSQTKLSYEMPDGSTVEVPASLGRDHVLQVLNPAHTHLPPRAVNDAYAPEPAGNSLGEIAEELGLWETD